MRTVMGETVMEGPSDAGSIPASSTSCNASEGGIAYADATNEVRFECVCSTNMRNPNLMNSDSVCLTSLEHEVMNHI